MKNFLPKSKNNPSGFTLIELMVVISIIAFLAVIGIAAYSQTQKTARDGRRKADVDAISQAYESNYLAATDAYIALATTQFANNVIPTDPDGTAYTYAIGAAGKGFYACAKLEILGQGNSTTGTLTAGATLTAPAAGAQGYYCRLSQQGKY